MKLVINIPCYNEEKTLPLVLKELPKTIEGIDNIEVQIVDDGSTDKTVEIAKKFGVKRIIKHKKNLGLGTAFKHGMDSALENGADITVNIDGDGQFNPKDISKLIQPILNEEADMVTCSRFLNPELTKNMPRIKKWGNRRFTKLVNKITGQNFTDTQCGFRAYSKEALLRLNLNGKFTYTQEVFIDLVEKGINIKEIPLEVHYFKDRKSHISGQLRKYGFKSLGIIAKVTRDSQPLTFFGFPAMIIFLAGVLGGLFSFFYWFFTNSTSPVQTLFSASVFLVIFGVSLGILALLADMLKSIKRNQEEIIYKLKKQEMNGKK